MATNLTPFSAALDTAIENLFADRLTAALANHMPTIVTLIEKKLKEAQDVQTPITATLIGAKLKEAQDVQNPITATLIDDKLKQAQDVQTPITATLIDDKLKQAQGLQTPITATLIDDKLNAALENPTSALNNWLLNKLAAKQDQIDVLTTKLENLQNAVDQMKSKVQTQMNGDAVNGSKHSKEIEERRVAWFGVNNFGQMVAKLVAAGMSVEEVMQYNENMRGRIVRNDNVGGSSDDRVKMPQDVFLKYCEKNPGAK